MAVTTKKELSVVGHNLNRVDALSKALGTAKYMSDKKWSDALVGKPLFAKHPHALIKNLDVSKATALEGVAVVMTAKDLPGKNSYGLIIPDKPVIADVKTKYQGDVIALVAAVNAEIAQQALELIEVEYELLPVYDDPRKAMEDDAVDIHDSHPLKDKGNRLQSVVVKRGDVEKAFAEADILIENYYETPTQEHCYFELDSCTAVPDPSIGGISLYAPQQVVMGAKRALAPVFNLPHNKVRVVTTIVGGGFGGREDAAIDVCAMAGVLALKTNKTVKVEYSREDVFRTTGKRHSAYIKHRLAANKDGMITAIDVETTLNKGAYTSLGATGAVILRNAVSSGGAYYVPNVNVRSTPVFTNSPYRGAFRGFGAPQAVFAMESQVEELARKLGVDSAEIRRKNLLKVGDTTITGQVLKESSGVGLGECFEKVIERIGWDKPLDKNQGHIKRGRGTALLLYGTSATAPSEGATCFAVLDLDGSLSISASAVEMGQGISSAFAQLASESLGVSYENILVYDPESTFPDAGPTVASRNATVVGNAVVDACKQIRERLIPVAAKMLQEEPDNIDIKNSVVYAINNPEKSEPLTAVIFRAFMSQLPLAACGSWFPEPPGVNPENSQGDLFHTYSFGAHGIDLEVDTETGVITILRSILAVDVGKAINPQVVEGQLEGGAAMGIGWATMEEVIMNNGIMENTTFHNYLMPTVMDLPNLESIIVEHPNEQGPYGVKGVGEPPVVAAAAAIRNALCDALGFKIDTLPLTASRVLMEIKKNADGIAER